MRLYKNIFIVISDIISIIGLASFPIFYTFEFLYFHNNHSKMKDFQYYSELLLRDSIAFCFGAIWMYGRTMGIKLYYNTVSKKYFMTYLFLLCFFLIVIMMASQVSLTVFAKVS